MQKGKDGVHSYTQGHNLHQGHFRHYKEGAVLATEEGQLTLAH